MITMTFANPEGLEDNTYPTSTEALVALKALEEKDIYINHQPVEKETLSEQLIDSASHIIIQDKLIGA